MNCKDLIRNISAKTNYTQKDISVVVDAMLDTIMDTVANGDEIAITGFGKFTRNTRVARVGVNPRTGEPMDIPEVFSVSFHAGSDFKRKVRG